MNDTKVISARLLGYKETREKLECLIERILSSNRFLAHIPVSKAPGAGSRIIIRDNFEILVTDQHEDLFECALDLSLSLLDLLHKYGQIPLPPIFTGILIKRTNVAIKQFLLKKKELSQHP